MPHTGQSGNNTPGLGRQPSPRGDDRGV